MENNSWPCQEFSPCMAYTSGFVALNVSVLIKDCLKDAGLRIWARNTEQTLKEIKDKEKRIY